MGKCLSEEHKQKIRNANLGKVLSEETKKKIGLASKGRHHSEKTKKKMREYSKLPVMVIRQRLNDVINISKEWGWKSKLARQWKINPRTASEFIQNHALDLIEIEV